MNDCAVKELQLKLCPPNRRVKKRKAQDKYASLADDGRESCNTALHINATCSEAKSNGYHQWVKSLPLWHTPYLSRRQGRCRHDRLWCMLRCSRSAISIDTATAFFCVAMYLLYSLARFSDLGSSSLVLQRAPVCDRRRCCACHAQCCA